jgi:hypothetical protein
MGNESDGFFFSNSLLTPDSTFEAESPADCKSRDFHFLLSGAMAFTIWVYSYKVTKRKAGVSSHASS